MLRKYSLLLIIGIILSGCIERPNFPVVPQITYNDIYFVDAATDSLVISLDFEDGDGDLGLSSSQTEFPFHQYNFYSAITGEELNRKANRTGLPVNLGESINFQDFATGEIDTLPPIRRSANCPDTYDPHWLFLGETLGDTIYYQNNIYHNNIYVTFLTRDPQGTFEEFDFGCGVSYNGRFPVLIDQDREKAVEGTLTYKMQGVVLGDILSRKIVKLRVYIFDRALHRSNIIETPEFILSEIER